MSRQVLIGLEVAEKKLFFYEKVIWWTWIKARLPNASSPPLFVSAGGGNWPLCFAAWFSCCTAVLFIKREAVCSKLLQIITICLQSPELSSKPAPILPSNFLSQNWTCGSLCVTTSLPSPGWCSTFSQYFFSQFRRVMAEHHPVSKRGKYYADDMLF